MAGKKKPSANRQNIWPKASKIPVAFMFQPTEYEVVRPERLAEWEKLMRESVGFPMELVKSISAARLTETICLRNGRPVD